MPHKLPPHQPSPYQPSPHQPSPHAPSPHAPSPHAPSPHAPSSHKLQSAIDDARSRARARQLHHGRLEHRALNADLAAAPRAHAGLTMPAAPGPSGETTTDAGSLAERRAVDLLERKGYEIVECNYRCKSAELDIVAVDGATMVFVEVRSRSDAEHGSAVESVTKAKQNKVRRAAQVYLAHRCPPYDEFRFDVVAIDGPSEADITHYDDAWRGGLL